MCKLTQTPNSSQRLVISEVQTPSIISRFIPGGFRSGWAISAVWWCCVYYSTMYYLPPSYIAESEVLWISLNSCPVSTHQKSLPCLYSGLFFIYLNQSYQSFSNLYWIFSIFFLILVKCIDYHLPKNTFQHIFAMIYVRPRHRYDGH